MNGTAGSITLIVSGQSQARDGQSAGHFVPENLTGPVGQAVSVDAGLIRANIDQCLGDLQQVFANLQQPAIDGWKVGTVTVGLTITAQGSIGIATAGVEASLEISFIPNKTAVGQ